MMCEANYTQRAKMQAELGYGKVDGESLRFYTDIMSNKSSQAGTVSELCLCMVVG